MRKISLAILVSIALPTVAAKSQNLRPVIVTSHHGEQIDLQTRRILFEAISEAMQTGMLKGLADQTYGTEPPFSGKVSDSPLGSWLTIQRFIDQSLDTKIADISSQLTPPRNDPAVTRIDIFWTKDPLTADADTLSLSQLGVVMPLAQPFLGILSEEVNPFENPLASATAAVELLQGSPADLQRYWTSAEGIYRHFASENRDRWAPLQGGIDVVLMPNKEVSISFSIYMIPGMIIQRGSSAGADEYKVTKIHFEPIRTTSLNQRLIVSQFEILRTYPSANNSPQLSVRFGHFRHTLKDMQLCTIQNCADFQTYMPTIFVEMQAGWLRRLFAKALSLSEFRVLVSKLALDANTLEIQKYESELPVIVKGYDGSWKTLDLNRSQGLNPLSIAQQHLLTDRLTSRAQAQLDATARQMEFHLYETINPVLDLVR